MTQQSHILVLTQMNRIVLSSKKEMFNQAPKRHG